MRLWVASARVDGRTVSFGLWAGDEDEAKRIAAKALAGDFTGLEIAPRAAEAPVD